MMVNFRSVKCTNIRVFRATITISLSPECKFIGNYQLNNTHNESNGEPENAFDDRPNRRIDVA